MNYENIEILLTEKIKCCFSRLKFTQTKINGKVEELRELENEEQNLTEEIREYKEFLDEIGRSSDN